MIGHTKRMSEQIHIFNRQRVRLHRDRAVAGFSAKHSALHQESAALILERVADVKRDFVSVLDLGAHDGFLASRMAEAENRFVVAADLSRAMLKSAAHAACAVADEECLPFADARFDLIVSNLSLHWVNDLPGALVQIKNCLRPDGMFLAALLGGSTLYELRECLLEAELAVTGGISPRLSPSIDRQTASALLQRAGFHLPVTDGETLTFIYSDIYALMRDVRGMGEANAHAGSLKSFARRDLFALANHLYREKFGRPDGRIPATFEIVFLHGWR